MAQTQKVSGVATKIYTDDEGYICVKYHNTDVVAFNDEEINLNSDGWRTVTTKTRMNQASNQFNLGYLVFQQDFQWFIDFKGHIIAFEDNISLDRHMEPDKTMLDLRESWINEDKPYRQTDYYKAQEAAIKKAKGE